MVFPPLDWEYNIYQTCLTISDLYGGYLVNPTGQIYESYRMLSSKDVNNIHIFFGNKTDPGD